MPETANGGDLIRHEVSIYAGLRGHIHDNPFQPIFKCSLANDTEALTPYNARHVQAAPGVAKTAMSLTVCVFSR